ncbi:MAG: hypothetical protein WBA39_34630 [Rivularia sp. (in: cyanobacteria)]|jgi:hypothetical protein
MSEKNRVVAIRILITQQGLRLVQRLFKLKMRLVASFKNKIYDSPHS